MSVDRHVEALRGEIRRLRSELGWYADPDNWERGRQIGNRHRSLTNWDRGERAREALAADGDDGRCARCEGYGDAIPQLPHAFGCPYGDAE